MHIQMPFIHQELEYIFKETKTCPCASYCKPMMQTNKEVSMTFVIRTKGIHNRITLEIRVGERVKINFLERYCLSRKWRKKISRWHER